MRSEFSEKEFEILFCHEFLNKTNCDFYFPSAQKEWRKGFDARFKDKKFKVLFFQFKVAEQYVRRNIWDFHFPTHATAKGVQKQHNTLVKLNSRQISAYYVVPKFIERSKLISFTLLYLAYALRIFISDNLSQCGKP